MIDTLILDKNNALLSLEDPCTAEEFARLDSSKKFSLHIKWAYEELYSHTGRDKLLKFDKPLIIDIFRVYKKDNTYIDFASKEEIVEYFNISIEIIKYLLKVRNKIINKPKFYEYNLYKIFPIKQILKGNDYIDLSEERTN